MNGVRRGSKVSWKWGNGHGKGAVKEVYNHRVSHTFKGEEIIRNGSPDDPAILIEQEDGDQVLKLASEVRRAE